eukprot:TRINITY_DN6808_c0_g1_i1.p1 TRINITY_DN6808_c0_g1~~TRINITY_DN6808_c0_g1_i1.p1  ORF type:complete len:182 (+),score=48.61 TRINITY_DN6808_c0_g1_i1:188-733(+)
MEADSVEKSLKATFAGAATQITQLYHQSIAFQKHSYTNGYNQAMRDIIDLINKNSSNRNIGMEELADYLRKKLEGARPMENGKEEVKNPPPENNFFKVENNAVPSSSNNFVFGHQDRNNIQPMINGFVFLPPDQNQQLHSRVQDFGFGGLKKRQFDPNNTMDFTYDQDHFSKKTKDVKRNM